jgi:hypothetical protein
VSADKALKRVPEIIRQVMEHVDGDVQLARPGDTQPWLRSMLIQLGAAGRALTYDHDALGLRAVLYGMAEIAVGWISELRAVMGLVNDTGTLVEVEAKRAHPKHGANSLLGDNSTTLERFAALAEECGEVADLQSETARLQELIQVASVCVSWIAWLDVQPQDEKCCVCCSGKIAYHNYQGKSFCSSCADGAVAVEAADVVSAEIHAYCGHCPDWHSGTPADQIRWAAEYVQKKYGPDTVYAVIQYGALGTVNIRDIYADEIPALRAANESAWMIVRPYEVK